MHGIDADLDNLAQYIHWDQQKKYRGVRFFWDGRNAYSKEGREIELTDEWLDGLPSRIALDCELYDGIDGERRCASVIRYGPKHITKSMQIIAFDLPMPGMPWNTRKYALAAAVQSADFDRLELARWSTVSSVHEMLAYLRAVKFNGGEGLMLRDPRSYYTPGYQPCLIKLKYAV
jgi:DNA ligase-1